MDWKKLGKRLLFPPGWLMVILTIFSAVALVCVFMNDLNNAIIAYIVYGTSAYATTVDCAFLGIIMPKQYRKMKQRIYSNPFGKRYMTDIEFKNHVSLYCSLGINLLYVAANTFSAIFYHAPWFGALAGYHVTLAVMRFLLVRYLGRNEDAKGRLKELQYSRICAAILINISLVLSGVVWMILHDNRGFEYSGMLIYIMAIYTFYSAISAIIDLIKYWKYNSPVLSTSKVIKTAAALVSMLSLETAMFLQFGAEMSVKNKSIMIIATGAGIEFIIIIMAIFIGVQATKEIHKIRRQIQNGK